MFKVEQMTEYERDELLKKWQLDKLLQQRKESEPKPGESSAAPQLNEMISGIEESKNEPDLGEVDASSPK